jgi:hypothetical protein
MAKKVIYLYFNMLKTIESADHLLLRYLNRHLQQLFHTSAAVMPS